MADEYKIELIERWTFLNTQHNPVEGYRVSFLIPELGITDHVVISEAGYSPDNVKAAIADKIGLHRALLS